jgi:Flp pilus assembly protein TadD
MKKILFGLIALSWSSFVLANDVAIVVGVSDYEHLEAQQDLKFADEDARLFARTLHEQMKFAKEDIIVLTSMPKPGERLATAENILAAFAELPQMRIDPAESKFIFYFSGHGLNSQEHGPHLAAQDHLPGQPLSGASLELTAAKIRERLSGITAGFALAVYDMCRPRLANSLDASKEVNSQFGLAKQNAKMVATVFSAVNGPSYEDEKLGHGIFTYYFCKGMTPEESSGLPQVSGMDEEGNVTLEKLQTFVRRKMAETSSGTPLASKGDGAFAISGIGTLPGFIAGPTEMSVPLTMFPRDRFRPEILNIHRYDVFVESGLEAYMRNEYDIAAKFFEDAFKLRVFNDVRDAWSALVAGYCYGCQGNRTAAEVLFRAAIGTDPHLASAMNNLGFILEANGDLGGAEKWYRDAIRAEPKNVIAMDNLAGLYSSKGYKKGAEQWWRRAISANPTETFAMYDLACLLHQSGDLNAAERWYRLTISTFQTASHPRYGLALLFEEKGDLKGAEQWYTAALSIEPDNDLFHRSLMRVLLGLGRKDRVLRESKSWRPWNWSDWWPSEMQRMLRPGS